MAVEYSVLIWPERVQTAADGCDSKGYGRPDVRDRPSGA